ncbi:scy1-like protein [Anaeramoeba flamelloides]|uniref:Scy1-like protein n=1 Tax=Anaeramoeba flamelloides TaxID=1746091 RepID=A0ABQ8ZBM0_9EUKA|nr:scy1-like protein [Anaeramoeba flamelloides]
MGNQLKKDYTIQPQSGSGGPGNCFKIYPAKHNKSKEMVSIFVFDKKDFFCGMNSETTKTFLQGVRRSLVLQSKIDHECILKLKDLGTNMPFLENKTSLCFITENVHSSLANCEGDYRNLPKNLLNDFHGISFDETQYKYGLYQVLLGLVYLHEERKQCHLNISPQSIYIDAVGRWKIGDFISSIFLRHANGETLANNELLDFPPTNKTQLNNNLYDLGGNELKKSQLNGIEEITNTPPLAPVTFSKKSESFSSNIEFELGINLDYSAPELIFQKKVGYQSDVWSFACLVYEIFSKSKLFDCKGSADHYKVKLQEALSLNQFINTTTTTTNNSENKILDLLSENIQSLFKKLLTIQPEKRLRSSQIIEQPFFKDKFINILQYLSKLAINKDENHKKEFIKQLYRFLSKFSKGILLNLILESLIEELESGKLIMTILPCLFWILQNVFPNNNHNNSDNNGNNNNNNNNNNNKNNKNEKGNNDNNEDKLSKLLESIKFCFDLLEPEEIPVLLCANLHLILSKCNKKYTSNVIIPFLERILNSSNLEAKSVLFSRISEYISFLDLNFLNKSFLPNIVKLGFQGSKNGLEYVYFNCLSNILFVFNNEMVINLLFPLFKEIINQDPIDENNLTQMIIIFNQLTPLQNLDFSILAPQIINLVFPLITSNILSKNCFQIIVDYIQLIINYFKNIRFNVISNLDNNDNIAIGNENDNDNEKKNKFNNEKQQLINTPFEIQSNVTDEKNEIELENGLININKYKNQNLLLNNNQNKMKLTKGNLKNKKNKIEEKAKENKSDNIFGNFEISKNNVTDPNEKNQNQQRNNQTKNKNENENDLYLLDFEKADLTLSNSAKNQKSDKNNLIPDLMGNENVKNNSNNNNINLFPLNNTFNNNDVLLKTNIQKNKEMNPLISLPINDKDEKKTLKMKNQDHDLLSLSIKNNPKNNISHFNFVNDQNIKETKQKTGFKFLSFNSNNNERKSQENIEKKNKSHFSNPLFSDFMDFSNQKSNQNQKNKQKKNQDIIPNINLTNNNLINSSTTTKKVNSSSLFVDFDSQINSLTNNNNNNNINQSSRKKNNEFNFDDLNSLTKKQPLNENENSNQLFENNSSNQLFENNNSNQLFDNNSSNQLFENNSSNQLFDNNSSNQLFENSNSNQLFENNSSNQLFENNNSNQLFENNSSNQLFENNSSNQLFENSNSNQLFENNNSNQLFENNSSNQLFDNNISNQLFENENSNQLFENNNSNQLFENNSSNQLFENNNSNQLFENNNSNQLFDNNDSDQLFVNKNQKKPQNINQEKSIFEFMDMNTNLFNPNKNLSFTKKSNNFESTFDNKIEKKKVENPLSGFEFINLNTPTTQQQNKTTTPIISNNIKTVKLSTKKKRTQKNSYLSLQNTNSNKKQSTKPFKSDPLSSLYQSTPKSKEDLLNFQENDDLLDFQIPITNKNNSSSKNNNKNNQLDSAFDFLNN